MRPPVVSPLFVAAVALALSLLAAPARAHEQGDEALPPPPVGVRVIAPSARGSWLLRIDNHGDEPLMIAADVRLLRFEVRSPAGGKPKQKTYAGGWSLRAADCNGPKAFGLTGHFPAGRDLVLEPGDSYVEQFDPRLICFDEQAELLVPGARIKAYYGWEPQKVPKGKMEAAPFVADSAKRPRRYRPLRRLEAPTVVLSHGGPVRWGPGDGKRGGAPREPDKAHAAEPQDPPHGHDHPHPHGHEHAHPHGEAHEHPAPAPAPADARPTGYEPVEPRGYEPVEPAGHDTAKEPATPAGARSAEEASEYGPRAKSPSLPPPPEDELAARLALTAEHYDDAVRPTDIVVNVQAHNVGERPIFIALRARQLSFTVEGPDGPVQCAQPSDAHHVPRDHFALLHHGKHRHMQVLLAEVCPAGTFDRPGLYVVTPILRADADGAEYGLQGATGVVSVRDPGRVGGTHEPTDDWTLVRVRNGRRAFYTQTPRAVPTRALPQ
jgi:hypothetical protein